MHLNIQLVLFTGCKTYQATFEKTPLKIDGMSSDWTTTLDSKNNNSFSYGISNDCDNIYVRININDQSIQRKLILAGLTVWIDTTGKKKENTGITCPTGKSLPKTDKSKTNHIRNTPEWNQNQLLEVEFSGFKKNTEIYFVSKNPYNVEISMCQDDFKSLYYEMKIPFKSIYSNYSNISHNTLSIGLETGELKLAASENKPVGINNNTRGEHPRGSSAGGGKRSGGNSKGQGYSGGTPNSSKTALSSPTKIWIKNILLATP